MRNQKSYRITESGQLVLVTKSESVITNPDALLETLQKLTQPVVEAAPEAEPVNDIESYYNLGEGICVHQQTFGDTRKTFGGIQLTKIPFYTSWELIEDGPADLTLIPALSNGLDLGAPLILDVPDDLIIHFFVEWHHPTSLDIMKPKPEQMGDMAQSLIGHRSNHYLTCFSKSRNTCLRLPLPNLYDDCHLCTGDSFSGENFGNVENHHGIMTSIKESAKAWSETAWNLDLLGGSDSRRMKQYRRLVRFNAITVQPRQFLGCEDWPLSTSPVPLEEVYRPWQTALRAVHAQVREGEEGLEEGGAAEVPDGEAPPALETAPMAGVAHDMDINGD
jgi:hypothetical protein